MKMALRNDLRVEAKRTRLAMCVHAGHENFDQGDKFENPVLAISNRMISIAERCPGRLKCQ